MISSTRYLSRSTALFISREHYLRPSAISSAAPFKSFSFGFGGNNAGFATVPSNDSPAKEGLTKADLAQIISSEHDLKMAESNRILDTLLDTIVEVRALVCKRVLLFFLHWLFTRVMCNINIITLPFHSSHRRCPKIAQCQSLALGNSPGKS